MAEQQKLLQPSKLQTSKPQPTLHGPAIFPGPSALSPQTSPLLPLPPLEVPQFSGDWKQWMTFIGLFETIIDNNPYLPPIQKLQYLRSYLQGPPLHLIANYRLVDDNYAPALALLKKNYTNERRIVDDYIAQLVSLPRLHCRSADGILNMSSVLTACLNGLKLFNINTDTWGPAISFWILQKLDDESRTKFEESRPDPKQITTTREISEFLKNRYTILLCNNSFTSTNRISRSFCVTTTAHERAKHRRRPPRRDFCSYCMTEGHRIYRCKDFLTLEVYSRIEVIQSKKLCVNCLGRHRGTCSSRFSCHHCNDRHHTLLDPMSAAAKEVPPSLAAPVPGLLDGRKTSVRCVADATITHDPGAHCYSDNSELYPKQIYKRTSSIEEQVTSNPASVKCFFNTTLTNPFVKQKPRQDSSHYIPPEYFTSWPPSMFSSKRC